MTSRDLNNWIMYHEIHQLSRKGFKKAKIAAHMRLDVRTVSRYLSMSEAQYEAYLHRVKYRNKVLSPYEDFVKDKLEEYPDTSSAQMHDWLKEYYPNLPHISPRTVYNFVMFVRQVHSIPLVKKTRDYMPIEELPYGQQAQVDFGEYNLRTPNGSRKKVYFFAMVLSRSRMKFVWFIDKPFTAHHVCQAHEYAFDFFGGIPKEVVYDLDRAIVVNENLGEIILTSKFKQYVDSRSFFRHFCRKADPESKGKVENVVKYTKQNFLYNRIYFDLETINQEALNWLGRTANYLIHNVTKKSPMSEHHVEKAFLSSYTPLPIEQEPAKEYQVRKDNTIAYKSNFYSLPIGTYKGSESKVIVKINEGLLGIYNLQEELICTHRLCTDKGKVIVNTNHKRDRTKSIKALIETTAGCFTDRDQAISYFQRIRQNLPRYIRDHLQVILKTIQTDSNALLAKKTADKTLAHCIENELFHGYDFEKVFWVLFSEEESHKSSLTNIKPLQKDSLKKANQTPDKSDIDDYQQIFNP